MRVIDPGHSYQLTTLDLPSGKSGDQPLRFVKREGPKYPGNVGAYPGTTVQEVLRACIERLNYVNRQEFSQETGNACDHLKQALMSLEHRAARRHGRPTDKLTFEACYATPCFNCGHIGCIGNCRSSASPHDGDEGGKL